MHCPQVSVSGKLDWRNRHYAMQPKISQQAAVWLCYYPRRCTRTQCCSALRSISLLASIWEVTWFSSCSPFLVQQMEAEDDVGWMQSARWRAGHHLGPDGLLTSWCSRLSSERASTGTVALFYRQCWSRHVPQRGQLNLLLITFIRHSSSIIIYCEAWSIRVDLNLKKPRR